MEKLAQIKVGDLEGLGVLAKPDDPFGKFNEIITNAVSVMTIIAGVWFIFLFITGAISWMTSGGDKGALESARKRMVNGITGIIIIIAAIFILEIVGNLIGFTILNPGDLLEGIGF